MQSEVNIQPSVREIVKNRPLIQRLFWWVVLLPIVLFVAVDIHSLYLLDFAHVFSGCLWTGTDIFMGFFIGPIMRRLTPEQRRAFIHWLTPKTMLYLPVLAFTTGTGGWIMSNWDGYLKSNNPERYWIYGALVIIAILAIQGFGILLPNSIRTYLELKKEQPSIEKITRLAKRTNRLAGIQGVIQILIILVMAQLATS
ncbi:hypothetical protein LLE49_17545 [Alicyclobacillus tolerans]|uniref:hypothetical protein n=1 Tax=Alicyclobacillus tolerans TaxID=90970 RepID=UPI001F17CB3F|nr:hypothetical protein [Alicyclobacillus tolerans]MCF8566531.1 hypothetical protein [Alicyclobacillus tolerans]